MAGNDTVASLNVDIGVNFARMEADFQRAKANVAREKQTIDSIASHTVSRPISSRIGESVGSGIDLGMARWAAKGFGVGILAHVADNFMGGLAKAIETSRTGGDLQQAILSSIPIFGGTLLSADALGKELWGSAQRQRDEQALMEDTAEVRRKEAMKSSFGETMTTAISAAGRRAMMPSGREMTAERRDVMQSFKEFDAVIGPLKDLRRTVHEGTDEYNKLSAAIDDATSSMWKENASIKERYKLKAMEDERTASEEQMGEAMIAEANLREDAAKSLRLVTEEQEVLGLKAQEKFADAEREQIRHRYQYRIDEAQKAGRAEEAQRLEAMRNTELGMVKDQGQRHRFATTGEMGTMSWMNAKPLKVELTGHAAKHLQHTAKNTRNRTANAA